MIVTDLDGTLLNSNKVVSNYTKNILELCRKSGIKLVFATGRDETNTSMVPDGLFDGKITMNGAVANVGASPIYRALIPYQTARPLLVACAKRGLQIASQFEGKDYSSFSVQDEWPWITNFEIVDFSRHSRDAEKIYAYNLSIADINFIEKRLPKSTYMIMAIDGLAMIMQKDATKSNAVIALAERWGVAKSEIVAFGDDLNDIDMLNYAGMSVAMSNALVEVKAVAEFVCDTNDNDGVAKWLEENVLNR